MYGRDGDIIKCVVHHFHMVFSSLHLSTILAICLTFPALLVNIFFSVQHFNSSEYHKAGPFDTDF
jgi:hypothetical protein